MLIPVLPASAILYNLLFTGIVCLVKSQTKHETDPGRCDNGTFYSRAYKMCVPCSACDVYSTQYSACTATADTDCIKCTDTSQRDLADHPACLQCPPCQPGEYMEAPCTSNTTTVCRSCPYGSFNTLSSYRTYCIPCTSCENQIMIRDCNASMDTECGACKKGYFRDHHRNRCNRCALCYRGQVPIKECKDGELGKHCSEFFFLRTDYIDVPLTATVDPSTAAFSLSTSTENISTSVSTDIVFISKSSFTAFNVTIILVVIFITLILCALIALLKYKLKMLTKTSHLLDDTEENSPIFHDDNFSHMDEVQLFQNLAESTFMNDCENQQCFTNHSSVAENQEFAQKPSDVNKNVGKACNFSIGNENSQSATLNQLYFTTKTADVYRIHGISKHESGQNSR